MASTSKLLLSGSVSRVILLVTNIGIGFFMLPFLVSSLGSETYGLWIFVSSIFAFYSLLNFGMSNGMSRYLIRAIHSGDDEDINVTLSTSLFLILCISCFSILVSIGVFFSAEHIAPEGTNIETFRYLVIALGLKVAVTMPFFIFYAVLEAKYRFDIISRIQFLSMLVRTGIVIALISNGYGIVAVAIIFTAVDIAACVLTVYMSLGYVRNLRLSRSLIRKEKCKAYLQFGKFVYVINIADQIKWSMDEIVIGVIISLSAVTHYTIALTLIKYFGALIGSLIGVVNPVLHKYHKLKQWDNFRDTIFVATELAAIAAVLVGGMLMVVGDIFVTLWVGEAFDDVYIPLLILLIAVIPGTVGGPGRLAIFAMAKHKYLAYLAAIEISVNVVLSIILAYQMGIIGVALGTAIPAILSSLLFGPIYLCNKLQIPFWRYYRYYFKSFLLGLVVFIPMYFVLKLSSANSFIELISACALFSLVYAVVALKVFVSELTTIHLVNSVPDALLPLVKHFVKSRYLVAR